MNKKRVKKGPKRYCIAAGCRNNDRNWNHGFFFLPARPQDADRVRQWVTLLGREDLLEKDIKRGTRSVCSAHFDPSSIKITKSLQENAVPTLLLANEPNSTSSNAQPACAQFTDTNIALSKNTERASYSALPSASAQIEDKGKVIVTPEKMVTKTTETQTDDQKQFSDKQTQTSKLLTEGTPRKKNLKEN